MDSGHLRILYWNAGGVRGKTSALRLLTQSQDIHIVLLGETKLLKNHELKIAGYSTYRRDEVSPQGVAYRGVAALVRRDIVHEELELLDFTQTRTVGVRTKVAGRETKIYAGYRPPLKVALNTNDFGHIFGADGLPTLMAADLNAKHLAWGSHSISAPGRALLRDAEERGYTIIGPDSPTNIPTNPLHRADVLDVVLHRGIEAPISIEVLYDLDDQHLPLLITVAATASCTRPRQLKRKTDWEQFQRELSLSVGKLSTAEEVETCATELTEAIATAQDHATTEVPHTKWREELPQALRAMRSRKRELRQLWAHTRCPRTKTELNAITERFADEVKAWRGTTWDNHIAQCEEDKTNLYNLNRHLTQAKASVCPLVDGTGQRRYSALERAELLADHLEGQFQLHPVPPEASNDVLEHHERVTREVFEYLQTPAPPLRGEDFIAPSEVARAVRSLKVKKAPGHDGIPNAALKWMPMRGLVSLTRLFNGILRTGHFPSTWKTGKVIVLPKPGKDRRQPASYRPITLLSHIAKLFERLLLRRLRPHLTPRDEQFGFRTQHSTTLQLTRVLHHLACEDNMGRRSVAVFLDVEKAFDRVWHEGLIHKMTRTTTPPALIRIVASFLADRQFFVTVENASSGHKKINAGVPQGSCVSPILYAAFTDDIPVLEDLLPGERGVMLSLFADDSAYIASSRRATIAAGRIQRVLDILPEWLDKWRMAVNVGKTAALLTGSQHRATRPRPLQLRGQDVKWEKTVKYLGVLIDTKLSMRSQTTHAVHQAKAARALLGPVLRSKLPLRTKVGIYKTYIRTRLTYAAPAWYALCPASQKKRLQVVQNVTLRMISGAGRYVRNDVIGRDLKTETVGEFVVRLSRGMFDRADNSPHPHLNNIAPHHARPPDVRNWRALPRDLLLAGQEEDQNKRDEAATTI